VSQGLPLPPADYLAVTEEEELVMYADKFHTKSRPSAFLSPDEYAAHVRRFGADKVTAFQTPARGVRRPRPHRAGTRRRSRGTVRYRMLCSSCPVAVTVQNDHPLRFGLTCGLRARTTATAAPLGVSYSRWPGPEGIVTVRDEGS
jgi:hypothetical protein